MLYTGLLQRQDAVDQIPTLLHKNTPPKYSQVFSSSSSQGSPLLIRHQSSSSLSHSQEYVAIPVQNSPTQFPYPFLDQEVELDRISVYSAQVIPRVSLEDYKKRLSAEKLKKSLEAMEMEDILYRHVKHWKFTARLGFGLHDAQIQQLDYDHKHSAECGVQAYLMWKKGRISSITVSEAIDIFYKAGEIGAIDALIIKLQRRLSK